MNAASSLFAAKATAKPMREHQLRGIGMIRQSLVSGLKRVVCQMPTGAGKTRLAAEIVNGALAKGKRVAFTVPAISLIDQTVAMFEGEGIDAIGVIQAYHPRTDYAQPVQVVSVQSLARRNPPEADVVLVDECHQQFEAVRKWMQAKPGTVFVGLSATPWARGMADDWQGLVTPVRMRELIDNGFLSPFRVFAPTHPDLTGVKVVAGEYQQDQLGDVMRGLVGDVVETWLQRARGLPTLVFAVNRAHAAHLVEEFARVGVHMGYCDAYVDLIERQMLFDHLASGRLAGIVNVGTLTTGVDADVRCVVLARPTRSEMLFVQMIGRGLRTAPGKAEALILDHADNHARMGFVTDIHYEELLSGRDKAKPNAKEKGEPLPKDCPSCGMLKPPKVRTCPACKFTPERGCEVEVEEGELVEITRKPVKADKQAFWSMALQLDDASNKGGRMAKAMYRKRFGVWPQGLSHIRMPLDDAFRSYVTAQRIAYAKGRSR